MPRLTLRPVRTRLAALTSLGLLAGALGLGVVAGPAVDTATAPPADAAGRVTVDNDDRGAVIDSRYSSRLRVSGRGFQSIKGGHGGIYVWFGTVNGQWRPSQGGRSGTHYLYIPDSESKGNAGYQRFVSFPGSDTASSANGGTISADGSWSVQLNVPGPTFQAVGRDGTARTVDCRKVTCGVITVGAHGVPNANNETFTPVAVRELDDQPQDPTPQGEQPEQQTGDTPRTSTPTATGTGTRTAPATAKKGPARLRVDRRSAVAGRALAFVATRLRPGEQVSVVLDDGLVASGPHLVGADGRVTGVISLPEEVSPGTHELRLFGASKRAVVRFPIAPAQAATSASTPAAEDAGSGSSADPDGSGDSGDTDTRQAGAESLADQAALPFAVAAALVFLLSLVVAVRRQVRSRRG